MKYKKLFSEGMIGNLKLKNRIVMPAMGTSLATSTGEASDEIIRYYEERAKGGCGLIITEITRIDNETGIGTPNQLCVTDSYQIPKLQKLTRAVHKYDTKIFTQLHHPGRQAHSSSLNGKQIVGPSPIASKAIGEIPRELETLEVENLVKKFIKGAKISQLSGFDGIELHGAHGYLICQFLSPATNKRTDKYGGTFMNRMRFLTEIIMGIRHICGKDFPISVRIDGDEFIEGGIDINESIKIARYLESIGIDAINVSSGTYESSITIIEPVSYKEGWKKHLSQSIKENIKIPVIACDSIKRPEIAENLLETNNLDFVALGRAQLADPEWGNKALNGKEDQIRSCISCLKCIELIMNGKRIECAVNPRVGMEIDFEEFKKDGDQRKVVIIGGGPAGMQAGINLAKRNFAPIIFEKEDHLGGSVFLGSKPPMKEKLKWFIDNMENELKDLNVDIRLNTKANIDLLKNINPYAIFIATGAKPILPNIEGINSKNVYTAEQILSEKTEIKNKKIAVIGSGMTGLETAEYLNNKNNKLTVVEMQKDIAPGTYLPNLMDILPRIKKEKINLLTSKKLVKINENSIELMNMNTKKIEILETDLIVLSLGVQSNIEIVEEIKESFKNIKIIGDVEKPGRIFDAMKSSFDKSYVL
ncbi:NAD(P)/FAD-dependent oxidoreductase [Oceanotoga sp. DSM 15011]|uniref:NAD(P)/FAD-dependent oxidoreductase n=1 Tax=Oceanotoga sp. DSM 15011 TaxID=2984951 RepID=UPI0021F4599C|nr:NAD(P)/FAD-dependent oxidoreductase [Oceanotoga sp. DSM 15011]UYP01185.1 NAD(P)/FAD-dependent oxidoreductase [Oceanotoga sp. DSM 15011]